MKNIRLEKLRSFLEENQMVTIRQISQLLPEVSVMTIHRDLDYLQQQGLAVKVRGGARAAQKSAYEPVFSAREIVNSTAKEKIAAKAVSLIGESGSVFLDAGTTILALARIFPDIPVSIVTTGPNTALLLRDLKNPAISLCGGILHKDNLTLTGSATLDALSNINIDTAFLVASGYGAGAGFTCGRESEARVKALAVGKARTRIMLLDCSKLDRVFPHTFSNLSELDYLVTEKEPSQLPPDFLREAESFPRLRIL